MMCLLNVYMVCILATECKKVGCEKRSAYTLTRKRFSEKPIVAFTNKTVDFYIYIWKACLVYCFGLEYLRFEGSSYIQLPED